MSLKIDKKNAAALLRAAADEDADKPREAALVMVSDRQERLDSDALKKWASALGIGLTLFHGWDSFVDQSLFWSDDPKPVAATRSVDFIYDRLIAVEAPPEAVDLGVTLTRRETATYRPENAR